RPGAVWSAAEAKPLPLWFGLFFLFGAGLRHEAPKQEKQERQRQSHRRTPDHHAGRSLTLPARPPLASGPLRSDDEAPSRHRRRPPRRRHSRRPAAAALPQPKRGSATRSRSSAAARRRYRHHPLVVFVPYTQRYTAARTPAAQPRRPSKHPS